MSQYTDFIPENVAFPDVKRIGIYNSKGNRVGYIPLGHLKHPNAGKKQYSFGALSDVHIVYNTAESDFKKALSYLNESEDVEFTCICGDLTDDGTKAQLAQYKAAVDAYSAGTPVYAIAGNHESYDGVPVTTEKIRPYTGQPFYYSFTHGDDVFIMCGCYTYNPGEIFTTDELQWLYGTLEANRNKRCFVFQHVFPWGDSGNANNAYTMGDLFAGTKGDVFLSLMRHYSNTVFFHGHSHLKFELQRADEKANYSDLLGYRSVHIPSLSVPRDIVDGTLTNIYSNSEGYVVDVYENGVHLRGRDFIKNKFLPIASYWLDTTIRNVEENEYVDRTGTIIISSKLPDGYILLEYIEATGAQYINTGITPNNNSRMVIDFAMTRSGISNQIIGSRNNTSSRAFAFGASSENIWRIGYNKSYYSAGDSDTNRHIADLNKNVLSLDGDVVKTVDEGTFEGYAPIHIGSIKAAAGMYEGYAKIYACQIFDDGILVRDLVPCINADGEIGMYDRMTRTFYGNVGKGSFEYGELTIDTISVTDDGFGNVTLEGTSISVADDGDGNVELTGNITISDDDGNIVIM